jgi:hypothetical protein
MHPMSIPKISIGIYSQAAILLAQANNDGISWHRSNIGCDSQAVSRKKTRSKRIALQCQRKSIETEICVVRSRLPVIPWSPSIRGNLPMLSPYDPSCFAQSHVIFRLLSFDELWVIFRNTKGIDNLMVLLRVTIPATADNLICFCTNYKKMRDRT